VRDFIQEHFGASVTRWDDYDGEEWTYEVIYDGQMIRATSPSLILQGILELVEPVGRILYLASDGGQRLAA